MISCDDTSYTLNKDNHILRPVILCGGSGSRLWPLSRELYPKPFINITREKILFIDTLERAKKVSPNSNPIIICNEAHRFFVLEYLEKYNIKAEIILEPEGRNTAPAAALAAFSEKDDILLIMPSDHLIANNEDFSSSLKKLLSFVEQGKIATFGILPDRAETGFGYLEKGKNLEENIYWVKKFIEKPDINQANKMLLSKEYLWNSGIFLMRSSTYLTELLKFSPDIYDICYKAWNRRTEDIDFKRPDSEIFLKCPDNSIDYAIMEKTNLAIMMPLKCQWDDLGNWDALYNTSKKDKNGNVIIGDTLLIDSKNCYINSQKRLIAAYGVKDLVIVESKDAILVIPRNRTQEVKKIVQNLKKDKRVEYKENPIVYRPWGSYETIAVDARFQVKRIIVKPSHTLSLQLHHHRAEHWTVVKGTAEITIDTETKIFTENQSTYIPVGSKHKLKNPGLIPLEIIEIQCGPYLGEDDIKRFEDLYGRI